MSNRQRPLVALALICLIGLICVGCGSTDPAAQSGTAGEASQDKLVKFANCIRTNGVPHFPDANAKGEYEFGIDVSPAVWQKAVNACKELEPPGVFNTVRSPTEQKGGLSFAACVRENGVRDFPDPADGQPLIDTTQIPSTDRPGGMDALNAAIDKCRKYGPDSAAGQ